MDGKSALISEFNSGNCGKPFTLGNARELLRLLAGAHEATNEEKASRVLAKFGVNHHREDVARTAKILRLSWYVHTVGQPLLGTLRK